jgi:hypothetical protein
MQCPKCGGDCYDNREKNIERKAAGQKQMPEFKCKDEACGWVKWPPKEGGKPNGGGAQAAPRGPKWTWDSLSLIYSKSLACARKHVASQLPGAGPETVISAAATIFIAASRDGVQEPVAKEAE